MVVVVAVAAAAAAAVDGVLDVAMGVTKDAVIQRTLAEATVACTGVYRLLPVTVEKDRNRDAAGGDAAGGGAGKDIAGDVRSSVGSKSMVAVAVVAAAACGLLDPVARNAMDGHLGECVASHRLPAWRLPWPPQLLHVAIRFVICGDHFQSMEDAGETAGYCWKALMGVPLLCLEPS